MESNNNIEIEKKYVIEDMSLKKAIDTLSSLYLKKDKVSGCSKDVYWTPPTSLKKKADFIRVRDLGEQRSQLTLKKCFNQHNTTRLEIDVNTLHPTKATDFATQLFGKPAGAITKKYFCVFLSKTTNISIYRIVGDKRVFLEIEAANIETVDAVHAELKQTFKMKHEKKSLYQLFIRK